MQVRDKGFEYIFRGHNEEVTAKIMAYHQTNMGLSRYHKIKYFYNELLNKEISELEVQRIADEFSEIMRKELINKKYLIQGTLDFIKKYNNKLKFYVASGSDQEELRYLCQNLGIKNYFHEIFGSPKHKNILVGDIVNNCELNNEEIIMIGDSINDYDAAIHNGIEFFGFNNDLMIEKSTYYLSNMMDLEQFIYDNE